MCVAAAHVFTSSSAARIGHDVRQLQSFLSSDLYELVPWTSLADFYNKTVTLFSSQVEVVKVIIGLIIVLSISNTQTMIVL